MARTALNRNGIARTLDNPSNGHSTRAAATEVSVPVNGTHAGLESRRQAEFPERPVLNGNGKQEDPSGLAVFCHEEPGSFIGQYVAGIVKALARRQIPVHLFARQPFDLDAPNIHAHVVGGCADGDVIAQAQDFARRAGNVFLQQFPAGSGQVTLMGFEWSAAPALSLLRGIRNADAILSLHSLERQRSDMTSAVSQQIEEIELCGLREARHLLIHNQATAEVAKFWVPECAGRIVNARPMFPLRDFEGLPDAGAVKARYQVGPIDPTILYVGDMDERYGPDMLMKAMPAVLKNNKQARLIIVGDGALYWPLRVFARYLLLEHAVRLPGSVEGKAMCELMQAADVVVVPSRESTPWWPILAAWAARRPLVATHTAAPGLLEHEKDSVLFYPSENSCVWGIERVLFDVEFGRALALQGHAKLEDRFGWNIVAEQVQELMGAPAAR